MIIDNITLLKQVKLEDIHDKNIKISLIKGLYKIKYLFPNLPIIVCYQIYHQGMLTYKNY